MWAGSFHWVPHSVYCLYSFSFPCVLFLCISQSHGPTISIRERVTLATKIAINLSRVLLSSYNLFMHSIRYIMSYPVEIEATEQFPESPTLEGFIPDFEDEGEPVNSAEQSAAQITCFSSPNRGSHVTHCELTWLKEITEALQYFSDISGINVRGNFWETLTPEQLADPLPSFIAILKQELYEWQDKGGFYAHTPYLNQLYNRQSCERLGEVPEVLNTEQWQSFLKLLQTNACPSLDQKIKHQKMGMHIGSDSILTLASQSMCANTKTVDPEIGGKSKSAHQRRISSSFGTMRPSWFKDTFVKANVVSGGTSDASVDYFAACMRRSGDKSMQGDWSDFRDDVPKVLCMNVGRGHEAAHYFHNVDASGGPPPAPQFGPAWQNARHYFLTVGGGNEIVNKNWSGCVGPEKPKQHAERLANVMSQMNPQNTGFIGTGDEKQWGGIEGFNQFTAEHVFPIYVKHQQNFCNPIGAWHAIPPRAVKSKKSDGKDVDEGHWEKSENAANLAVGSVAKAMHLWHISHMLETVARAAVEGESIFSSLFDVCAQEHQTAVDNNRPDVIRTVQEAFEAVKTKCLKDIEKVKPAVNSWSSETGPMERPSTQLGSRQMKMSEMFYQFNVSIDANDIQKASRQYFNDVLQLGSRLKLVHRDSTGSPGAAFSNRPGGEMTFTYQEGKDVVIPYRVLGAWEPDSVTTPLLELVVVYDMDRKASLVGKFMNPKPVVEYDSKRSRVLLKGDHVFSTLADESGTYFEQVITPSTPVREFLEDIVAKKSFSYNNPLHVVHHHEQGHAVFAHKGTRGLHATSQTTGEWLFSQAKFCTYSSVTQDQWDNKPHINGSYFIAVDNNVLESIVQNPAYEYDYSSAIFNQDDDEWYKYYDGEILFTAEAALQSFVFAHLSKSRAELTSPPPGPISTAQPPRHQATIDPAGTVTADNISLTPRGVTVGTGSAPVTLVSADSPVSRDSAVNTAASTPNVCQVLPIKLRNQPQWWIEWVAMRPLRHEGQYVDADGAMTVHDLAVLVKERAKNEPHRKQQGQWRNGIWQLREGYRSEDVKIEASHTLNSLMAVSDKYRFGYINAGRYQPEKLMADREFHKAWPNVEWVFPGPTADPTLTAPPLEPRLLGRHEVDKRMHIYNLAMPNLAGGITERDAVKYGCKYAGIFAIAGHSPQGVPTALQTTQPKGFQLRTYFQGQFYKDLPHVVWHTAAPEALPSLTERGLLVGGLNRNLRNHTFASWLPQQVQHRSPTIEEATCMKPFKLGYTYLQGGNLHTAWNAWQSREQGNVIFQVPNSSLLCEKDSKPDCMIAALSWSSQLRRWNPAYWNPLYSEWQFFPESADEPIRPPLSGDLFTKFDIPLIRTTCPPPEIRNDVHFLPLKKDIIIPAEHVLCNHCQSQVKNGLRVCADCKRYIDYDRVHVQELDSLQSTQPSGGSPPAPSSSINLTPAVTSELSSSAIQTPRSARSAAAADLAAIVGTRFRIAIRTAESRKYRGVLTAAQKLSFRQKAKEWRRKCYRGIDRDTGKEIGSYFLYDKVVNPDSTFQYSSGHGIRDAMARCDSTANRPDSLRHQFHNFFLLRDYEVVEDYMIDEVDQALNEEQQNFRPLSQRKVEFAYSTTHLNVAESQFEGRIPRIHGNYRTVADDQLEFSDDRARETFTSAPQHRATQQKETSGYGPFARQFIARREEYNRSTASSSIGSQHPAGKSSGKGSSRVEKGKGSSSSGWQHPAGSSTRSASEASLAQNEKGGKSRRISSDEPGDTGGTPNQWSRSWGGSNSSTSHSWQQRESGWQNQTWDQDEWQSGSSWNNRSRWYLSM